MRNQGTGDAGIWGHRWAKGTQGRGITAAWGHKGGCQRGLGDTEDVRRVNVEDLETQGRGNMGM